MDCAATNVGTAIKAAKVRIVSVRMTGTSYLRRWLSPHHNPRRRIVAVLTRRSATLAPQTYLLEVETLDRRCFWL